MPADAHTAPTQLRGNAFELPYLFQTLCCNGIMPKQYSAFKALMSKKGQVDMLISALTNLLAGPVWINERHICTALASVSKRFHKRPTISVLFH
eukprot:scaffold8102_cov73-Cyclotella_meneghiniana.AAC.2